MAKDGTIRGGARQGAGRKQKSLEEKIADGRPNLKLVEMPVKPEKPKKRKLKKFLQPAPKEGQTDEIKERIKNYAVNTKTLFKEAWGWLDKMGVGEKVAPHLIDEHVALLARFIECERELTEDGLIKVTAKGNLYIDPRVKASLDYVKQANNLWYGAIGQIVRENSAASYDGEDDMEKLLKAKRVI